VRLSKDWIGRLVFVAVMLARPRGLFGESRERVV